MNARWSKLYLLALSTILALAVTSRGLASAADGPVPAASLKARVIEEYPRALARLEALYSRVKGEGRLMKRSTNAKGVVTVADTEIRFVRDGKLCLGREKGESGGVWEEAVRATNSRYSFRLSRDSPDKPFVIRNVAGANDAVAPEFGRFYFDVAASAPFSAFGRPISEIMALPSYKLKDVSEVEEGGRRLVKIAFDFRPADDFPVVPSWILVDPAEGWTLRRYEGLFGAKRDLPRTSVVEYAASSKGRPIPRSVRRVKNHSERTFEITNLEFDVPVREAEFMLTAFGLPELDQPAGTNKGVLLNSLLLGLGLAALGVAIGLKFLGRRIANLKA